MNVLEEFRAAEEIEGIRVCDFMHAVCSVQYLYTWVEA